MDAVAPAADVGTRVVGDPDDVLSSGSSAAVPQAMAGSAVEHIVFLVPDGEWADRSIDLTVLQHHCRGPTKLRQAD
jgi:hypothetical protein